MNEVTTVKRETGDAHTIHDSSHKLCPSFLPPITSLPLVCRAHGRPGQKRTETRCGTPGARGANVPVPVEEEPRTPSDDASAPSKAFHLGVT